MNRMDNKQQDAGEELHCMNGCLQPTSMLHHGGLLGSSNSNTPSAAASSSASSSSSTADKQQQQQQQQQSELAREEQQQHQQQQEEDKEMRRLSILQTRKESREAKRLKEQRQAQEIQDRVRHQQRQARALIREAQQQMEQFNEFLATSETTTTTTTTTSPSSFTTVISKTKAAAATAAAAASLDSRNPVKAIQRRRTVRDQRGKNVDRQRQTVDSNTRRSNTKEEEEAVLLQQYTPEQSEQHSNSSGSSSEETLSDIDDYDDDHHSTDSSSSSEKEVEEVEQGPLQQSHNNQHNHRRRITSKKGPSESTSSQKSNAIPPTRRRSTNDEEIDISIFATDTENQNSKDSRRVQHQSLSQSESEQEQIYPSNRRTVANKINNKARNKRGVQRQRSSSLTDMDRLRNRQKDHNKSATPAPPAPPPSFDWSKYRNNIDHHHRHQTLPVSLLSNDKNNIDQQHNDKIRECLPVDMAHESLRSLQRTQNDQNVVFQEALSIIEKEVLDSQKHDEESLRVRRLVDVPSPLEQLSQQRKQKNEMQWQKTQERNLISHSSSSHHVTTAFAVGSDVASYSRTTNESPPVIPPPSSKVPPSPIATPPPTQQQQQQQQQPPMPPQEITPRNNSLLDNTPIRNKRVDIDDAYGNMLGDDNEEMRRNQQNVLHLSSSWIDLFSSSKSSSINQQQVALPRRRGSFDELNTSSEGILQFEAEEEEETVEDLECEARPDGVVSPVLQQELLHLSGSLSDFFVRDDDEDENELYDETYNESVTSWNRQKCNLQKKTVSADNQEFAIDENNTKYWELAKAQLNDSGGTFASMFDLSHSSDDPSKILSRFQDSISQFTDSPRSEKDRLLKHLKKQQARGKPAFRWDARMDLNASSHHGNTTVASESTKGSRYKRKSLKNPMKELRASQRGKRKDKKEFDSKEKPSSKSSEKIKQTMNNSWDHRTSLNHHLEKNQSIVERSSLASKTETENEKASVGNITEPVPSSRRRPKGRRLPGREKTRSRSLSDLQRLHNQRSHTRADAFGTTTKDPSPRDDPKISKYIDLVGDLIEKEGGILGSDQQVSIVKAEQRPMYNQMEDSKGGVMALAGQNDRQPDTVRAGLLHRQKSSSLTNLVIVVDKGWNEEDEPDYDWSKFVSPDPIVTSDSVMHFTGEASSEKHQQAMLFPSQLTGFSSHTNQSFDTAAKKPMRRKTESLINAKDDWSSSDSDLRDSYNCLENSGSTLSARSTAEQKSVPMKRTSLFGATDKEPSGSQVNNSEKPDAAYLSANAFGAKLPSQRRGSLAAHISASKENKCADEIDQIFKWTKAHTKGELYKSTDSKIEGRNFSDPEKDAVVSYSDSLIESLTGDVDAPLKELAPASKTSAGDVGANYQDAQTPQPSLGDLLNGAALGKEGREDGTNYSLSSITGAAVYNERVVGRSANAEEKTKDKLEGNKIPQHSCRGITVNTEHAQPSRKAQDRGGFMVSSVGTSAPVLDRYSSIASPADDLNEITTSKLGNITQKCDSKVITDMVTEPLASPPTAKVIEKARASRLSSSGGKERLENRASVQKMGIKDISQYGNQTSARDIILKGKDKGRSSKRMTPKRTRSRSLTSYMTEREKSAPVTSHMDSSDPRSASKSWGNNARCRTTSRSTRNSVATDEAATRKDDRYQKAREGHSNKPYVNTERNVAEIKENARGGRQGNRRPALERRRSSSLSELDSERHEKRKRGTKPIERLDKKSTLAASYKKRTGTQIKARECRSTSSRHQPQWSSLRSNTKQNGDIRSRSLRPGSQFYDWKEHTASTSSLIMNPSMPKHSVCDKRATLVKAGSELLGDNRDLLESPKDSATGRSGDNNESSKEILSRPTMLTYDWQAHGSSTRSMMSNSARPERDRRSGLSRTKSQSLSNLFGRKRTPSEVNRKVSIRAGESPPNIRDVKRSMLSNLSILPNRDCRFTPSRTSSQSLSNVMVDKSMECKQMEETSASFTSNNNNIRSGEQSYNWSAHSQDNHSRSDICDSSESNVNSHGHRRSDRSNESASNDRNAHFEGIAGEDQSCCRRSDSVGTSKQSSNRRAVAGLLSRSRSRSLSDLAAGAITSVREDLHENSDKTKSLRTDDASSLAGNNNNNNVERDVFSSTFHQSTLMSDYEKEETSDSKRSRTATTVSDDTFTDTSTIDGKDEQDEPTIHHQPAGDTTSEKAIIII